MSHAHICQQQALGAITKQQTEDYPENTVVILGIAGGNGLEHIAPGTKVYGIDVSAEYLSVCAKRYAHRGESLQLIQADLSDEAVCLPTAGLIIANLFIEYIGISCFVRLIKTASPRFVSCVIQDSRAVGFVSSSPYTQVFSDVESIHKDIDAEHLCTAMEDAGYALIKKTSTPLPNHKRFLRLDFKKEAANRQETP